MPEHVTDTELRTEILRLVREYASRRHAGFALPAAGDTDGFTPGASTVPYAGRVFDADEVEAGVASMLDFWLTLGPEGEAFERELASMLGVRNSILVNSGSSANLVAFSALTSPKLGDRRLKPGDEVITVAAGFPPRSRRSSKTAVCPSSSTTTRSRSTAASTSSTTPILPARHGPS